MRTRLIGRFGVSVLLGCLLLPASAWGAKVCIDPGHGGSDPGAGGYGLRESDVNLDIGLRARDLFLADGWQVVMTRTTDVYVSLQGRCDISNNNGANKFLCSHCNAFNGAAYGTETFSSACCSGSQDYDLRDKINAEMVSHMGTYNRGNKTADFYVLNGTTVSAILCEVAFIDNAGDSAKLGNASYRQEAARAYLHGTQSHYGITPHDPVTTPDWDGSYSNQSYPSSMTAGTTAVVWAEFVNRGTQTWAHCATKLGTSSPHERSSAFCTLTNWSCANGSNQSCARPTDVDQSAVTTNNVGRFTFILTAPATPGTYVEKFQLLREGITWFGPEITWTITVTAAAGTVTGTVTNASTSAPISGAAVTLSGGGSTTTNGSGVYTFSNVTAGSYTVSVTASGFNGGNASISVGAGATTTQNFALTPLDTEAPSVPTALVGSASGPTTVQLSWTASTDNVGVVGYEIRRDGLTIGSSTTNSYVDNAATANTTHVYQVRAKDAVSNYSGWSASAEVTTPPGPPQPTVVFADGFNGNLDNWVQQVAGYAYSTTVNQGVLTGAGAAYVAAGEADQMYHVFARPFAQGKVKGSFWDGKGGYKVSVCGWAYRQALSLRTIDGSANMFIDNEFYSAADLATYHYRLIGTGGVGHTAYATRDPNTDCTGTWVTFETEVVPGTPNASPTGTFTAKVTDRAGTTTTTQNLTTDFFSWGFGRITLGLGVTSANEGYWDDISLEATPPGTPTLSPATVLAGDQITWNFTPADNRHFGWDVANTAGTVVSPTWPNEGWLGHNASSWTETGLSPNTAYSRKIKSWNGTLDSQYSSVAVARTLSAAPAAGSVTPDNASPCSGDNVTWTAVDGFGAGKVEYYAYAWDTNPSHTFTGAEPVWASGTLALPVSAPGLWYLHVKGYNADDVANGTFDYSVTAADCNVIPTVTAAVSRKTHGGSGNFDINVMATNAIENRTGGPTQVVVTFSDPIGSIGALDPSDVSISSGSVSNVAIADTQLTVGLAGAANGSKLVMTFPGIVSVGGTTASPSTICFGVLAGDATADGTANVFDLVAVRNTLNLAVGEGNFRNDMTTDGSINIFDVVQARNNLNTALSGSCPP